MNGGLVIMEPGFGAGGHFLVTIIATEFDKYGGLVDLGAGSQDVTATFV